MMIVGADTELGLRLARTVTSPDREIRAFVSDPHTADHLRSLGVKVALGDVSDPTHIGAACTGVFTVVFVTEAAHDERVRDFIDNPATLIESWGEAAVEAGARRVIWVGDDPPAPTPGCEFATVGADLTIEQQVARIVELDDALRLG